MSPTHRWSHFDVRADTEPTPTRNDDAQFTPGRLVVDTAPPATPTFVPDAATTSSASLAIEKNGPATKSGMSNPLKLGLAMIPVVVILIGLYILFLFWYRKRRAARKQERVQFNSPPVPEKDFVPSYNSSISSKRASSKVLNMAAFSTPLDGPYPKMQPVSRSAMRPMPLRTPTLPIIKEGSLATPWTLGTFAGLHREPSFPSKQKDNIQINIAAAKSCPTINEAALDSPIDGSSPFRLKRGDTVKRCSLGSDLFRLWPTPPTSVWIRPMSVYENMYDEVPPLNVKRQSSMYRQPSSIYGD